MNSDNFAILTLAGYAAIAAGIVYWRFRRSGLDWSAWFLFACERLYVGMLFQWRSNRRCPFPDEGPAIIIANHRSPIDPLLIWMNNHLGPRLRLPRIIGFMTAREYCEMPGLSWICRSMQSIPVARQGKDMAPARAALERLNQGHLLGVFPEGRINPGVDLLEGDPGIAWLALRAQVPVFPVYLHNSPSGVDDMVKPFYSPRRVRIVYGDPIDLSAYADEKRTQALLTEVTDLLMRRLAELGGVAYSKDREPESCRREDEVPQTEPGGAEKSPRTIPIRSTG